MNNSQFQMNQIGMNMSGNMNNQNLQNNMNQNQINPFMNMNNLMFIQNNIQMAMPMNSNFMNPYQRIIELENIIRQKDEEIEELKNKLKSRINDFAEIFCSSSKVKFKFYPLDNHENQIEFEETCYDYEKFINIKKRIAKKINKNYNNLILQSFPYYIADYYKIGGLFYQKEPCITVREINKESNATNNGDNPRLDNDERKERKVKLTFVTTQGSRGDFWVPTDIPIGIILIFFLLKARDPDKVLDIINRNILVSFVYKTFPLKLDDKRELWEIIDDSEKSPIIIVNFSDSLIGG